MNFNKKFIYALIFVNILFTFYKFSPVLFNNEKTLANHPDAIGAISNFYQINEYRKDHGIKSMQNDLFMPDKVGLKEYRSPYPVSLIWKNIFACLSSMFNPITAYSVLGLISYILIFLSGFLLINNITKNPYVAILSGFLLSNLDNFYHRIDSHLPGLGFYFAHILLINYAINLGKTINLKNLFLYFLFLILAFQFNEYYGYFGLFISATIVLTFFVHNNNFKKIIDPKIIYYVFLCITFFLASMIFLYPNVIGKKIFTAFALNFNPQLFGENFAVASEAFARETSQFHLWTAGNILYIFKPNFPAFLTGFIEPIFKNKIWEFSYRIGLLLPLLTIIIFIISKKIRKNILVFLPALIITTLFATSMKFPLSLVHFTQKYAPMFRVGVRTFIYFDILIIIMFTIVLTELINRNSFKFKKGLISIIALLSILDVSGLRAFQKIKSYDLPYNDIYKKFEKFPKGNVMELPIIQPGMRFTPEESYVYYYNQIFHKNNVLNHWAFTTGEYDFLRFINSDVSLAHISLLKKIGTNYVVVNENKMKNIDYSNFYNAGTLILQDDKEKIFIFKIN